MLCFVDTLRLVTGDSNVLCAAVRRCLAYSHQTLCLHFGQYCCQYIERPRWPSTLSRLHCQHRSRLLYQLMQWLLMLYQLQLCPPLHLPHMWHSRLCQLRHPRVQLAVTRRTSAMCIGLILRQRASRKLSSCCHSQLSLSSDNEQACLQITAVDQRSSQVMVEDD